MMIMKESLDLTIPWLQEYHDHHTRIDPREWYNIRENQDRVSNVNLWISEAVKALFNNKTQANTFENIIPLHGDLGSLRDFG